VQGFATFCPATAGAIFCVRLLVTLVVVAAACVSVGCAAHPAQPSRPLGQPFDLRAGASAVLSDGFRVTFDGVRSDSRCPLDALCVQAGEAVVALTLSAPSAGQVERELRTAPGLSELTYLSYVMKLTALAPFPRSAQQIRPEDYVATFTVERR
jgi:hypothetical protein